MTLQFTTVIKNDMKLIITTIPDDINAKMNEYVEKNLPSIQEKWENTVINRILGTQPNMNAGIYSHTFFDNSTFDKLSKDTTIIIFKAYELLTTAGFNVKPNEGLINIDIFNIDTTTPTDTNYVVSCDKYESCIFYIRKDEYVKGNMDIYLEPPSYFLPSVFGMGKYMTLPTKSNLAILRSGNLYYKMQPRIGFGKEYIISVHLAKY